MIELNDKNFEEEILKTEGKVVVDFYADWCGPCKMMGPIVEELSNEIDNVKFGKINVDESELSQVYGVMSIPTIIVFENGKEINRSIGLVSKDELEKLIIN